MTNHVHIVIQMLLPINQIILRGNCWTNFVSACSNCVGQLNLLSADLLLVCTLANATCANANMMTALIFIIVSRLHAFFLVVVVRSFLHVLVAVVAIHQHSMQGYHSLLSHHVCLAVDIARHASVSFVFCQACCSSSDLSSHD